MSIERRFRHFSRAGSLPWWPLATACGIPGVFVAVSGHCMLRAATSTSSLRFTG